MLLANWVPAAGIFILWGIFGSAAAMVLVSFFVLKDTTLWGKLGGYKALRSTPVSTLQLLTAEILNALLVIAPIVLSALLILLYFSIVSRSLPPIKINVLVIYLAGGTLALLSTYLGIRMSLLSEGFKFLYVVVIIGLIFFVRNVPPGFLSAAGTPIALLVFSLISVGFLVRANLSLMEKA